MHGYISSFQLQWPIYYLHEYISSFQLQWPIYFFDVITLSLSKAALNCENFIIMGDFSIDLNFSGPGKDKLDELCNMI